MQEPAFGDRVLVRPHANIRVQEFAHIPGRVMRNEWVEREWDDWLHRRYTTGEIMIKPVEAPEEEAPVVLQGGAAGTSQTGGGAAGGGVAVALDAPDAKDKE